MRVYPLFLVLPLVWLSTAFAASQDFNGDGKSDLLMAKADNSEIHAWYMNGSTKLSEVTLWTLPGWKVAASCDVNGDHKADLILRKIATGNLVRWVNGKNAAPIWSDAQWTMIGCADFNGDGLGDVLYRKNDGKLSRILLGRASNAPLASPALNTFKLPSWADAGWVPGAIGDFNGDGIPDLLWQKMDGSESRIWISNGAENNGAILAITPGRELLGVGDFNGDGTTDVLDRKKDGSDTQLHVMRNGVVSGNFSVPSTAGWTIAAIVDLNGDGKADLVQYNGASTAAWLMNGATRVSNTTLTLTAGFAIAPSKAVIVDAIPPSAPTGLSATATSINRIALTWTTSADNIAIRTYRIYRNGSSSALAETASPSYADTTVSPNTSYQYQVRAVDIAGNESALSTTATATTPAAPQRYLVYATLTGLASNTRLILANHDTDLQTATQNGAISFGLPLNPGSTYNVTIRRQPAGQTCTVSNGSGVIVNRDIHNLVVSCAPSTLASIFFSDPIESSVIATTNNAEFAWTDSTYTSVVTHTPKLGDTGSKALQFYYKVGENLSEQRYVLGKAHPEIWIRYWLQVPTNFKHTHPAGFSSNMKLGALWMDGYSVKGLGPTIAWEFWEGENNGSLLAVHYSPGNFTVANEHVQHAPFISYPADQGRWMQIVLHVQAATSPGSKDGLIETYRRWDTENTFTQLHKLENADISMPAGGPMGWKEGYFMGWTNPGYPVDTYWHLNDVEFSNASLLDVTPVNTGDTTPPSVVTGLVSSQITSSAFTLNWNAATDNVAVTAYDVFLNGNKVGTTSNTQYTYTGLSPATAYNLTVKAVDAAGNVGNASATLVATTASSSTGIPGFGTHRADLQKVASFSSFIESDFTVFWPYPNRAYPALPLDFQFIVYEAFKQPLHWELVTGPSGMTISQAGLLQWTPAQNQMGDHAVTIKVTRESGESISKSFTTNVNTTDFLFVSTTGSDLASGSLAAPLRTVETALRAVASGNGKTIYVRNGTYAEHYNWEVNGSTAPTRSKTFTPDDPLILSSYPGEHFILDAEYQGHGLWSTAPYVIFKNLEVTRAGPIGERAGLLITADNDVLQNTTVRDSQWSRSDNVAGIKIGGKNIIVDRAAAYNNKDPNVRHWNSSNYLVYTDGGDPGPISTMYILRSSSYNSDVGFKIKHAGPNYKLIVHDCYSENDLVGFGGSSDYSSVRYSKFVNNSDGSVALGMTDPTSPGSNGTSASFNEKAMLIEHNTMINNVPETSTISESGRNFSMYGGYSGTSIVQKNIMVASTIGSLRQVSLWIYSTDLTKLTPTFDQNVYFNSTNISASADLFRRAFVTHTFSNWKGLSLDTHSKVIDPGFLDTNYTINTNSPAVFSTTEFAGSELPLIVQ